MGNVKVQHHPRPVPAMQRPGGERAVKENHATKVDLETVRVRFGQTAQNFGALLNDEKDRSSGEGHEVTEPRRTKSADYVVDEPPRRLQPSPKASGLCVLRRHNFSKPVL